MTVAVLDAFSDLLRYPGEGRSVNMPTWIDEIRAGAPDIEGELEPLREYSADHDESALEEVFVRTFENNKERALELGWHLHGENYARGTFMARMRGILRDLKIEESVELPDHVSHMLSVVSHAKPDLAKALARQVVSPALTKIEAGFTQKDNPYYGVIVGLHNYIDDHFADNVESAQEEAKR